jgi:SHS2 domain-containing protein
MLINNGSGFEEIEHTADLCLKVWGTTITDLFINALDGMYHIMKVLHDPNSTIGSQKFFFEAMDQESLLVAFLDECNYFLQQEKKFMEIETINIENSKLQGTFKSYQVEKIQIEIKGVTFHNLVINHTSTGYSVQIVFDV